jgi:hypothetical protein
VRPIIRGKLDKAVEFGAKLSVSLSAEGLARKALCICRVPVEGVLNQSAAF